MKLGSEEVKYSTESGEKFRAFPLRTILYHMKKCGYLSRALSSGRCMHSGVGLCLLKSLYEVSDEHYEILKALPLLPAAQTKVKAS